MKEENPIAILANAINQLALIVNEIAYYCHQSGYTDIVKPRRNRWQEEALKIQEGVAHLIPE